MPATRRLGRSAAGAPTALVAPAGSLARGRCGASSVLAGGTFSTTFPLTESPMREGGSWRQGLADGLDWTDVNTTPGRAFGTQSGQSGFTDSIACLSGFAANQSASAVVLSTATAVADRELEVLLRWDISAHVARGYECNFAWDGSYAQIVWWRGDVGGFQVLRTVNNPISGQLLTGDILTAQIVGRLITLTHTRGATVTHVHTDFDVTDATATYWPTGNPGLGFWQGLSQPFGFSSFSATELP